MKSYKVEIIQIEKYVVDVQAENEEQAKTLATEEWNKIAEASIYHYYQEGDTETEIGTVFDVTGTDDAPQDEIEEAKSKVCSIVGCNEIVTINKFTRYYNGHAVCDKHAYEIDK